MKNPKVELNEQEWGQVLDGLACRVALYEETVGYYKHGVSYGHIAEVNGVEEAQAILRYYRRIIRNIKKQLGEGGYIETTADLCRNIS
jgi:DNA polymerase III delta prime subunit